MEGAARGRAVMKTQECCLSEILPEMKVRCFFMFGNAISFDPGGCHFNTSRFDVPMKE